MQRQRRKMRKKIHKNKVKRTLKENQGYASDYPRRRGQIRYRQGRNMNRKRGN